MFGWSGWHKVECDKCGFQVYLCQECLQQLSLAPQSCDSGSFVVLCVVQSMGFLLIEHYTQFIINHLLKSIFSLKNLHSWL